MDRAHLLEMAKQDPRFQQAADQVAAQLAQSGASPEMLDQLIEVIEHVLENPQHYEQIRAQAIKDGFAREQDLPPQFNEQFLMVLLLALYNAEDALSAQGPQEPQAFACGGLAKYGRGGDTILAHINSREAEVLRRMGGSGTVNPNTGLREFKGGGLQDVISIAAPMALNAFFPGMGSAIGGALGGGALGAIGSQAITGGLTAALSGGDIGKGALGGALGGGLGSLVGEKVGGWAGDALGKQFSDSANSMIGNALVGGVGSALQGGNFGQGLARGAMGSMAGNAISGIGVGDGAVAQGLREAGSTVGNALTAGYTPQQALMGGALTGLARGFKPKDAPDLPEGAMGPPRSAMNQGLMGSGVDAGKLLAASPMLLTMLGQAETPEQVQQGVKGLSPEQQEYFNRASQQWDWNQMQRDAAAQNMSLGSYMSRNWPTITGGKYTSNAPRKFAMGGLSMLAQGGGTGRSDEIDAKLSDGEYVIDAETVALLGDGSTKAGAQKLDLMRKEIRQHKGRQLAKGQFSPDAKSPLSYLKEAA